MERERGWSIAAVGLWGLAAYFIVRGALGAIHPYGRAALEHPETWRYPIDQVTRWLGAIAVEYAIAVIVLRAASRISLARRALGLAAVMLAGAGAMIAVIATSDRGGPPASSHVLYLAVGAAWLVVFTVWRATIPDASRR